APAGIEFYQPLFFETTATLFDYLPSDAVIVHAAALPQALERACSAIGQRYEDRRHHLERPILEPRELFLEPVQLLAALEACPVIVVDAFKAETELARAAPVVYYFPTGAPRELRID